MRSMMTAPAMTKMMPGMTGMIKPMIPMMIKRVARLREMKFFHLLSMDII